MTGQIEALAALNTLEVRSIANAVYGTLRKAIFDGELRSGERLVESQIAQRLNISRAPIREALHRLQQAGLVEHRPRRGWFVIGLTPDDLGDLYHIRAYIEGLAARRLAAEAPSEILHELQALITRMISAADREDLEALTAYDVQFHEAIIRSGGSGQLERIWRLLRPEDWTAMSVLKVNDMAHPEIAKRHQFVLDALSSGDPDWAETVVRRHILELARLVPAPPTLSYGGGPSPSDA